MSSEGKICPQCGKDIGFSTIMMAGLPTMMKCKFCKTKIKYEKIPWLLLLTCAIIYFMLVYVILNVLFNLGVGLVISLLLIFLLWQPFEIVLAWYLRKNGSLTLK